MSLIKIDVFGLLFNIFLSMLIINSNNKETLKRISVIILGAYFIYINQYNNIDTLNIKEGKKKLTEGRIILINTIIIKSGKIIKNIFNKNKKKEIIILLFTNLLGIKLLLKSNDWI